ncbi:MAG TPA: nucleotidyltransferase family protein [Casimicrobiaceae bacterium]|nr:nucleotidyltransferase family protein [Casimicrobiaceae bacterium]
MRVSPDNALKLLVRLLRRDSAGVRRCVETTPDALDELASIAADRGLAVVLLRSLADSALMEGVSADHRRTLLARAELQSTRCTVLEEGLERVAALFAAADLPFVLLKGPYLAARFYGDPRGREFRDLDLLVRRADRPRAFGILSRAGYARRSRILGSEALTAFFVHGFDYVAGGVNLDLHWCICRHPSLRLDEAALWKRKKTFRLNGRAYSVLSEEDEVRLQVLALLRDIERGRPQMKNFVDLVQIAAELDPAMSWDSLFTAGRLDGTHGPLVNVLTLCVDVVDAWRFVPRLAATLKKHAARRVGAPQPAIEPASRATRYANRLWAARSYDSGLGEWLGWWALSLPFRRAAHGWPRPVPPRVRSAWRGPR